jgi:endonuclease/exonuclease/phosphatase family metal-dependent hydrolase
VRILSLNSWGGALYDRLAGWLPEVGADVVCLQEMTRAPGHDGWTTFADGERSLPQRANLFDDVRALLPDHGAHFAASDAGPVIGADGRPHREEVGLGLFVADRLRTIDVQSRFVHGRFSEHEVWPTGGRPRIAQAVRLLDRTARPVTVVQLHGLRDPAGKGDTPARCEQVRRLASFVDAVRKAGDVTIVCGDFNLLPTSDTFAVLGRLGLVDLVRDADTRTGHYAKAVRHASYMLVSDPAVVHRLDIVAEPAVSDHCALVLELRGAEYPPATEPAA